METLSARSVSPFKLLRTEPAEMTVAAPCDAVLATRLSGLTQVQKDAGRTVDALTRDERRPDQAKQPRRRAFHGVDHSSSHFAADIVARATPDVTALRPSSAATR